MTWAPSQGTTWWILQVPRAAPGHPELQEVLLPTQAQTLCLETLCPIISAWCTAQRAERMNPSLQSFCFWLPELPLSQAHGDAISIIKAQFH